ncbi:unnamed protein product [Tenebrio molitor]|nr:unnamed protein product [Tenebrio molitor]
MCQPRMEILLITLRIGIPPCYLDVQSIINFCPGKVNRRQTWVIIQATLSAQAGVIARIHGDVAKRKNRIK